MSATVFNLAEPAPNGLRRGITTGTCATAAVKAALAHLLFGEMAHEVNVTLADGTHFIPVEIKCIRAESDGAVRADVIKDAGDDPDQTHRATIFARVKRNDTGAIHFKNARGVGVVTQPGLQIPVGDPAINPVPREMMRRAVREVLDECGAAELRDCGFDLEIGCENGEDIARRTFNLRLGVQGGISILGTTGIVEPKSMASFKASIEVYIRVALGDRPAEIVLAPGNLGQKFARASLGLPIKQVVQMSNFVGFALDCVNRTLTENDQTLPRLWVVGHPGKLAKLLDGVWETHSSQSESAVATLCRVARELWPNEAVIAVLEKVKTVEGLIEILSREYHEPNTEQDAISPGKIPVIPSEAAIAAQSRNPAEHLESDTFLDAPRDSSTALRSARNDDVSASQCDSGQFWREIEARIARIIVPKLERVGEVRVRLFKMDATPLGGEE